MSGRLWSDSEIAFLTECANAKIGADGIGALLERPASAVRMKRIGLGLPPPRGSDHYLVTERGAASVAEIKRTVADHFNIAIEDMVSRNRERAITRPRQVAMFFARGVARKSYTRIGEMFGGRDHTTVIHAVRQISRLMAGDEGFKDELTTLRSELVSANTESAVDKSQSVLVSTFPAAA